MRLLMLRLSWWFCRRWRAPRITEQEIALECEGYRRHLMAQRGTYLAPRPAGSKLLLAGNHRPRMRSADDAMRRRMQVIPLDPGDYER